MPPQDILFDQPASDAKPRVSALVGSSEHGAIACDALKDDDNAAWVMRLPAADRAAWIERIRWIRIADRLAEAQHRGCTAAGGFSALILGWQHLAVEGRIDAKGPHAEMLTALHHAWYTRPDDERSALSIASFGAYLAALDVYHGPAIAPPTLDAHDHMLIRLSGPIFQLIPFLPAERWDAAARFGALDQLFNNLRDLDEDAAAGLSYFPDDVLARFGLDRDEMRHEMRDKMRHSKTDGRARQNPAMRALVEFWVEEHLPTVRRGAEEFLADHDHPSHAILQNWSLRRYERIERVLRECNFDFQRFPARYWPEVKRDLVAARAHKTGCHYAG